VTQPPEPGQQPEPPAHPEPSAQPEPPAQHEPTAQPYPGGPPPAWQHPQPYPGQPYPGQPYPGAQPGFGYPPPRKSRALKITLIILGLLVVVCGLFGIGGFVLFKGIVGEAIGPVRDDAGAFLSDLRDGNTSGAYSRLCSDTRSRFTEEQFAAGVAAQPKIRSYRITGSFVHNTNGSNGATVTAVLTSDTGFTDTHQLRLVHEAGAWKVCGNPY
jgi:hypothetical protein